MARDAIAVAAGLDTARLGEALADLTAIELRRSGDWFVAAAEVALAARTLADALDAHHQAKPLEPGMSVQAWRSAVRGPLALAELGEADLLGGGTVVREGALVRRPGFEAGASDAARAGAEAVLSALRAAGAEPPSVAELGAMLVGVDVPSVLRLLARAGQVTPVGPDRYYATEELLAERDRLVSVLTETGNAPPALLRERLGRSRKWLIPFLEWADREGVTIRDGDGRRLHPRTGA
jgi:selenocysteine-specific elongation factor